MMEQTKSGPCTCKKCGKEIESGKYCGVCQTEMGERNKKIRKCCAFGVVAMSVIARVGKNVIVPAAKKAIETMI